MVVSDARDLVRGKHLLEADVELSDGTIVRVTGLLAVRYRSDPEVVRKWVENEIERKIQGLP